MDESVSGRHRAENGGPSAEDVIRRATWTAPTADESFAGDLLADNRDMQVSS